MPQQGASNEDPKYIFSWRNKENINTFRLKKSASSDAMEETLFLNTWHMEKALFKSSDMAVIILQLSFYLGYKNNIATCLPWKSSFQGIVTYNGKVILTRPNSLAISLHVIIILTFSTVNELLF